jgi:hypothetical protein
MEQKWLGDVGRVWIAQEIASFASSSRQASLQSEGKRDAFVSELADNIDLRNMWGLISESSGMKQLHIHIKYTFLMLLLQVKIYFDLLKRHNSS